MTDESRPTLQTMHMGARNGMPERRGYVYRGTGRDDNPETNPSAMAGRYRGGIPGVRRLPKDQDRVRDGAHGTETESVQVIAAGPFSYSTERLLFERVSEHRQMVCGYPHNCGGDEEEAPRRHYDRARGSETESVQVIGGAKRCKGCGYLDNTVSHGIECGEQDAGKVIVGTPNQRWHESRDEPQPVPDTTSDADGLNAGNQLARHREPQAQPQHADDVKLGVSMSKVSA